MSAQGSDRRRHNGGVADPEIERTILGAVTQAADRGELCPPRKALARLAGCSGTTVYNCLSRLERSGVIAVERVSNAIRVTINATGRSTATPGAPASAMCSPARAAARAAAGEVETPAASLRDPAELAARIERDQAAIRNRRLRWLEEEQQRYRLPVRPRLIDEMPA